MSIVHQPRFIPNYACGFTFRGGSDGAGDNNRTLAEQKCAARREGRIAYFKREKEAAEANLHTALLQAAEGWREAALAARKV